MPPRSAKKNAAVPTPAKKTPAKAKQTAKAETLAAAATEQHVEQPAVVKEDPKVAEEQKEVKVSVELDSNVNGVEPVKVDTQKPEVDENIEDEKSHLNDSEDDPGNQDAEEAINEEDTNMETNEDVVEEEDDKAQNEEDDAEDEDGGEEEDEEGPEGGEGDENDQQVNDVPAPLKDRQKQKEFEIFVGGLDKEANEEDLKKVFGEVGEIVEVRMSKNQTTQKNKGFAFVRYATVEEAKRALTQLKNPQVREKKCGVSASQDNDTLYVGNICKTWTKEAVSEKLKEYGVENIEEIVLMDDVKNEGQNRGYIFLEFTTHQDAINAFRRLQKPDAVFGCDKSAKVAFAESSIRVDEEVMAQVKTVFLDALPESWDDEKVKEELKKYGEIEKVQLSRNMSSAKRKDYGFVSFISREDALACVEGVNSSDLGEGDIKIKANIAKPQHKNRLGKKGVRGGFHVGDTGNKSKKVPKRFKSKGFRGAAGRFRGKNTVGKKEKAAENKDNPKGSAKKDVGQKRKRDNGRKEKGDQDSSFRQDRRSRRNNQAGRAPWLSRNAPYPRDSYRNDSYTRHLELVNSYANDVRQPYASTTGSKRPYSALDDVPRYSDPPLRHSRPRLDYDVGSASLYGGSSYEESMRLGRAAEAGYGVHPRSSYGIYDSEIGYNRSSLAAVAGVGGAYSSGYASSSIPGRVDSVGGSYSSLYSSHRPATGYLPGRGSGAYY